MDERGNLWFVGINFPAYETGKLYSWPTFQPQPEELSIRDNTEDISGICYNLNDSTLIVGLHDERSVIKISQQGHIISELANDIDPRCITSDTMGNVYVSDQAEDVVWKISGLCQHRLLGDLNNDCRVDLLDLAIMARNWLIDCIENPENPSCI